MPSGTPILGKTDLLSQETELVATYWDYKNNKKKPEQVHYRSGTKYYWLCPKCGKSYLARVVDRVVRTTPLCNDCAGWKSKKSNKTVRDVLKNINIVWDYANNSKRPEECSYQSSEPANWICAKCGHHYPMRIQDRVRKGDKYTCPICTNRELKIGVNDFVTVCKKKGITAYKDWDYEKNGDKRPENYFPNYEKEKFYWHCNNTTKYRPHSYRMTISARYYGQGCNICANRELLQGVNDLFTVCNDRGLDLVEDWDYENNGDKTPYNTIAGGRTEINWVCHKCGHHWTQSIHNRLRGYGCPACNTSRAEKLIQCILKKWKIPFKIEYSFTDNITPYPFDFYIPSQRILIEYDGIQHFKPIPFFNKSIPFRERVRRDNVKNACTFNEGYSLLRIPYIYAPEDNKEDIAKLIADFIKTKKIPQEIIDFYAKYEFSNYAPLARKWNETTGD
ncbi:Probable Zinc-ribbon domain-containing protein [Butyrivibrio proteoclasticus]|uniref:Probable Zinc-ribbon domain-containing protein n=1 Tax=Butyrivibrio proteoclasticus TaxID=43305 RepID=A0A1I5XWL4_9FIRM|nr:zinc-ribbon domain-containing protein [Butyrivibrio proteoclasticus]SFQ36343.1 Probable Zinc-ribbon domain-containing protein [Butyrivibrio proteoclasticus]